MLSRALSGAAGVAESALAAVPLAWGSVQQARVIREQEHRPWPLPEEPWVMAQTWNDLLFAHWPVPVEVLRPVVPPRLPIDTFDGAAWVGITPFEVAGLRLRGTLPPPVVSRFPELNVRTYTTIHGRPGIYFLSLDAGSRLAVAGARHTYRLPYFRADMGISRDGDRIGYRSERRSGDGPPAAFRAAYRPLGPAFQAKRGSLEHFLAERYCLYTLDDRGAVHRGEIHHPPWPLQAAEAELVLNTMASPYGIELSRPPLLHFAARQDVVIWRIQPVG